MVPTQERGKSNIHIPYNEMKYPIVYISLGSIISNRGFCKECIRAFGNKELSVILNTGKIDPTSLGKIPDNIYAYSFVPQIVNMGLGKKVRSFPSSGKELYRTVCEVYKNENIKNNVLEIQQEIKEKNNWEDILKKIEALCHRQ